MTEFQRNIENLQLHTHLILRTCGTAEQELLLKELTAGRSAIDLSLPNVRMLLEQNPREFVRGMQLPVYLANLHYAPHLLTEILRSDLPLDKIIASCTQSYYLQMLAAQSGGGRVKFFDLPLKKPGAQQNAFLPTVDYLQNLAQKEAKHGAASALIRSGMCGAEQGFKSAEDACRALQQEVMATTTISDSIKFYRFLCAAAGMAGKPVNYAMLAGAAGISSPTAKQWTQFLAGAGAVYLLPAAASGTTDKRLVKAPKLYFRDTGAAAYLLQLYDSKTLLQSMHFKDLFENYAVNAVRESWLRQGMRPQLQFYRDFNSKEISLILQYGGVLYPLLIIQESFNIAKTEKSLRMLEPYAKEKGARLAHGCVLTMGRPTQQLTPSLWQVNVEAL